MSEVKPVAWVKDTSIVALSRNETIVLAYPHDFLIRPAVPIYTADALAAVRREALKGAAQACDDLRMAWIEKHGGDTAFDAGHLSAYANAGDVIRALLDKPA